MVPVFRGDWKKSVFCVVFDMIVGMIAKRNHEDIILVAGFLLHAYKKGGSIFRFPHLEEELGLTKSQIINIFKMLKEAKVIEFVIIPWVTQDDEDFYFKKPKDTIERETGGFSLINFENLEKTKSVFKPDIEVLEKIMGSEKEMSVFLKKYGKFYDSTLSNIAKNEANDPIIVFGDLNFNGITGDFSFCNTKGNLPPLGQEFKVLKTLLASKEKQSSYTELINVIYPGGTGATKANKANLYKVINNIKKKMGILEDNSNKDIFKMIKNNGYRLVDE